MDLIIVESPTKARTLSRFLGKAYQIEPTMGHLRDLPPSKLGVDVQNNFQPDYVIVKGKEKVVKQLKAAAQKAEKIYLATDPDREGEAIAHHTAHLIKNGKDISRISFHEITSTAIQAALDHPHKIDMHLVDAQTARRVLDRLVGYKLSPILWKKVRKGLSAGRVQSPAVRLIVEREREIAAFTPEEYWEIFAHLSPKDQKNEFIALLTHKDGKKLEIKNQSQADPVVADLKTATYQVAAVARTQVFRSPRPPFTTSTLQQTAANSFSWSAKRTMQVAQRLYEEGLITYHRTDSVYLAPQALKAAREVIITQFGNNYLPQTPRVFKTQSKLAQEAHESIRPTDPARNQAQVTGAFARDTHRLYQLIRNRFLASQMKEALYDRTKIDITATKGKTDYTLKAEGKIIKFPGWLAIYGKDEETDLLPQLAPHQPLQLIKLDPQQKFTPSPPRYTEASLIKTLEKMGIGRPSTYAPIISTIQDRLYVEKKQGKFYPTQLGETTNDFLIKYFDKVMDYDFTAQMEDQLDEIAKGQKKWVPIIKDFYQPFSQKLKIVEENAKRVKIPTQSTGRHCPKCKKGNEVIRIGRFGKFLSCSRFPNCDYTAPYVEKLNMKCPECGQSLPTARQGEVIIKKTKKGKIFYGCSRYPKCKWASWTKPQISPQFNEKVAKTQNSS